MKLSDLKTGERGIIVKVLGHGGFRKRIIEMGFVKGKTVEVLLNAPLQDPVKYKLMGYEVSLRHQEADQIEVVSEFLENGQQSYEIHQGHEDDFLQHVALRERRTIHVALIGNPNCGKTSLFNYASGAHAHVGNYSGVTVDAMEAHTEMFGYEFLLTDLPGTYSLSCYSPEELYVREHLANKMPDVVINVIDASNLERNLYLTTQLVDMNVRTVCALNMFDEFERRGDTVNIAMLSSLFGIPMIPTSFKSGRGVKALFRTVIQAYEDKQGTTRHLHINYGHEIEQGISHIQQFLKADEHIRQRYSTRYLAIKLLEHDSHVLQYVGQHLTEENMTAQRRQLLVARDMADARVREEMGSDSETAIMDAKYGFINGALKEAGYKTGTKEDTYRTTHIIDHILSHKIWGLPIFFAILFIMFHTTFALGQHPMDWIESGVAWFGDWVGQILPQGPLRSMLVEGVIGGVGSVIIFLPQILILYSFISLMEDSGYMARAAFIMDRLMHKMGLHGKSFIPLVMGFGCNVPAVMATRTIESRRSRLITMMILPFMSCSARLPIYIMIIGTFFATQYRSWIMLSLYTIGILLSVIVSKVFTTVVFKGEDTPFVMEF
ncbi:MAG: ferrous iron transport protein B, partial [Prevotella sp.]|nr:ferrous iron transport protein B [Prevotella sp.]